MKIPASLLSQPVEGSIVSNHDDTIDLAGNITVGNARDGNLDVSHLDSVTRSALDAVMATEQQSYEQFIGAFSQLSAADVPAPPLPGDGWEDLDTLVVAPSIEIPAVSEKNNPTVTSQSGTNVVLEDEELQVEMLEETSPASGGLTSLAPGRTKVQFDNFVDADNSDASGAEDTENEDLDICSDGYQASFLPVTPKKGMHEFGNEGDHIPDSASGITSVPKVELHALSNDILSGTCGSEEESSLPSESLNHLNLGIQLSSTGEESDVKMKSVASNKTNELFVNEDIHVKDNSDSEPELIYEPLGVPMKSCQECNSDEELVYDCSHDLPNPGEIQECDTNYSRTGDILNNRELNFSVKTGSLQDILERDSVTKTEMKADNTYDDVQPFSIDEDFDYDNVVLTPKFTPEEMAYLNSLKSS